MRVHRVAVGIVALACLVGCATKDEPRFVAGTGDAGPFMLQHALAHGGRPVNTNNLPILGGPWRYFGDEYGIVVRFPRERFSEVQTFLRRSFGDPVQEPIDTTNGKLGWYAPKDVGVAIQLAYDQEETQVIVLQTVSSKEVFERMPDAMKGGRK